MNLLKAYGRHTLRASPFTLAPGALIKQGKMRSLHNSFSGQTVHAHNFLTIVHIHPKDKETSLLVSES